MQNLELGLFLLTAFFASAILVLAAGQRSKAAFAFAIIPAFCVLAAIFWLPPDRELREIQQEVPQIGRREFAGSGSCRSCHISHYHSWHDSYHRTMTQLASEEAVLAPFDGRVLESKNTRCVVERQGSRFIVEMADPDWEASYYREGISKDETVDAPRVRLPVVMTTGSHHLQTYWVPSEHGNKLRLFPWVFHIDTQRWLPNGDSFILPPDSKRYTQVWNNSCIVCHCVAGDVGYDPGNWQSRVAELGVACEACHGPGAAHVNRHTNPLTRYKQRWSRNADPSIVNPARLSAEKSSQICGQCHSGFDEKATTQYNTYRAGGDFHASFSMADPHDDEDMRFWTDGTIRVGGRELSGMTQSACFQGGELSCLSCHSMHSGNPNKQLQPALRGDQACLQCHQEFASDISHHTRHAVESPGSRCVNCHMPHTTYALFNAARSHRIDSPNVATTIQSGRPNACNQCHVNKSLGWTDRYMQLWYGSEPAVLSEDEQAIAASVLWLLRGDAIQRVLAAWSFGWEPARQASGEGWQTPFLAQLLDDPYTMARYMTDSSLKKLGTNVTNYDSLVSPAERLPMAPIVVRNWLQNRDVQQDVGGEALRPFFSESSGWNEKVLQRLLQLRDDRPVVLYE